jgi:hypothetical protein
LPDQSIPTGDVSSDFFSKNSSVHVMKQNLRRILDTKYQRKLDVRMLHLQLPNSTKGLEDPQIQLGDLNVELQKGQVTMLYKLSVG